MDAVNRLPLFVFNPDTGARFNNGLILSARPMRSDPVGHDFIYCKLLNN